MFVMEGLFFFWGWGWGGVHYISFIIFKIVSIFTEPRHRAYFIGLHECLDDVETFNWLVQNQDC